jgi:pyrroloquinoline-quinone synthase
MTVWSLRFEMRSPKSREEFLEFLKDAERVNYHNTHPFHLRMHEGQLSKEEIQTWMLNRFYYQKSLPRKDAHILSKLPTREDRRRWLQRIIDHDGREGAEGGIESWLYLGESVGLDRQKMLDDDSILPAVRFAVDAYVNFCRNEHWLPAVASSLTELFAPKLMEQRIAYLEKHYKWIPADSFKYFRNRLNQAPRDVDHALELVLTHCTTVETQEMAVRALRFKCELLWAMLDAIEHASSRDLVHV